MVPISFFAEIYKEIGIIGLISFLFGLIGLILAIVFYIKSIRVKKPLFATFNYTVIDNSVTALKKLRIDYEEMRVERLTVTSFVFWNEGKAAIRKSDIPQNSDLSIIANDQIKIFDAELIPTLKESNNIRFDFLLIDNGIEVKYDYLDYKDGFILRIYHSGNDRNSLSVNSEIIDCGPFREVEKNISIEDLNGFRNGEKAPPIWALVLLFIAMLAGIYFFQNIGAKIILGIFGIVLAFLLIKDLSNSRMPKSLVQIIRSLGT